MEKGRRTPRAQGDKRQAVVQSLAVDRAEDTRGVASGFRVRGIVRERAIAGGSTFGCDAEVKVRGGTRMRSERMRVTRDSGYIGLRSDYPCARLQPCDRF